MEANGNFYHLSISTPYHATNTDSKLTSFGSKKKDVTYLPYRLFRMAISLVFAVLRGILRFRGQFSRPGWQVLNHASIYAQIAINWSNWKRNRFKNGYSQWIHVVLPLDILWFEKWPIYDWQSAMMILYLQLLAKTGHITLSSILRLSKSVFHVVITIGILNARIQRLFRSGLTLYAILLSNIAFMTMISTTLIKRDSR